VLALAKLFIARTCKENSCGPCSLSSEVFDALMAYSWPGNVRELENAIERAVVLAEGQPRIELGDLPVEVRTQAGQQTPTSMTLAEVERRHILSVLEAHGGNRGTTARALDIAANTLWRRLKTYGLPPAR
jgi:Nif-specific regulatory protein